MALPPKTIFIDIDGTICEYNFDVFTGKEDMKLLPGVLEKFAEWRKKKYNIILTTGRGLDRETTEAQLARAGILYDQLVMGIGGGKRVLINDIKPDGYITAIAYCLPRNIGLEMIDE